MAQYTRKAILATLTDMLRKMPLDKITVSAIVSACEISPNTFYYHFRDIYDLLEMWLQEIKKKYLIEPLEQSGWKEATRCFLRVMKDNADIVYHLFDSLSRERMERYVFDGQDDMFYDFVCSKAAGCQLDEETLRYIAEYASYAIIGFILKFVWHRMESDIDTNVDKIGNMIEGSVDWAIKYFAELSETEQPSS